MKLDPYLTSYVKTKSTWVKDLNIRARTIKLLEENKSKSSWPWIWQQIFRYDTRSTSNRSKWADKLDFLKIKRFCASKDTIKGKRRHREQILANHFSNKGIIPRIFKNSYNSTKDNPIKNLAKDSNRLFFRENIQMVSPWKDTQHHQSLGKCKSNP